jgi:UDP-N-acetylglucosamine:LPS N-acetylglucosamine transferase
MGGGHDAIAGELARRLAEAGVDAEVVDVLALLPLRLGPALRRWYGWMVRRAPWMYALIYRVFFTSAPGRRSRAQPLTVLAAARLRGRLRRDPVDEVVSTFHLAAQAAGHLRERGRLPARSTVLFTDFAVNRLWLHPGNDLYLCPHPGMAAAVAARTGRPARCNAPVVRRGFRPATGRPDDRLVLISAGSWGVGEPGRTARALTGPYRPLVLCGRNEELRRRLGTLALGWRDDMAELMASAYALVDNVAGLTCQEAFAAGLPVICYRPIPGHGRDNARAMERAGVSVFARDPAELRAALNRLGDPAERERLTRRAAALFTAPEAEDLLIRP